MTKAFVNKLVFLKGLMVSALWYAQVMAGVGSFNAEHDLGLMGETQISQQELEWKDRNCLGHHLIIDLFGCNPEKIKHVDFVEQVMLKAAKAARATVIAHKFHQFNPFGVSGAIVVSESHLAIHTWPEVNGYCAIDIFTCGSTDNFAALEVLKTDFEAKGFNVLEIDRGKKHALWSNDENEIIFRENLDPLGGFRTTVAATKQLEVVESEYQRIEVYDTKPVGKMLVIDGIIQCTEYDNAAYHEMIVHVPMNAHPHPKKALIIGGGDGGALAELVKYEALTEIVICDIDPMVAKVSERYFPDFARAYKDPRVRAVYQDGAELVKNFKDYFDIIIVDSTDFYGVAQALARKEFYESIYAALTHDGIAVAQSESLYFDRDFIVKMQKSHAEIFPVTAYYYSLVPTYPSGTIGFSFCSKRYNPSENLVDDNKDIFNKLTYYTPEVHRASFALPAFLKNKLEQ